MQTLKQHKNKIKISLPKSDKPSFAPEPPLYADGCDSFWNICNALIITNEENI